MNKGVIVSIRQLVVLVRFDELPPAIGEILVAQNNDQTILLVEALRHDGTVVCLNIRSEKTIQRGLQVERTGSGIEIAVGPQTIGRIFDALGRPLDELPSLLNDPK